ncbi:NAD(P)H-binding protein [Flavobacteriaceae bacterium]|nr:NAD(P)H-binding protein [Flavobacteriaceae bacterium]
MEVSLFGASGLIGNLILEILIHDAHFNKINVVTRRPFNSTNKKVVVHLIDFSDTKMISKIIQDSCLVFASIGTTQKKVKGNKDAYREIDYDILVNIAKACKKNNVKNFLFVSSSGADTNNKSFYLGLKGEIEDSIIKLKLPSTSIFRPSLLLGKRNENRFGEGVAKLIMPLMSFAMPSKYKPIDAKHVASAMVNVSKKTLYGPKIYHYNEIINDK